MKKRCGWSSEFLSTKTCVSSGCVVGKRDLIRECRNQLLFAPTKRMMEAAAQTKTTVSIASIDGSSNHQITPSDMKEGRRAQSAAHASLRSSSDSVPEAEVLAAARTELVLGEGYANLLPSMLDQSPPVYAPPADSERWYCCRFR